MIISNHNNYYLKYNSFLLCKGRNAPSGVAFIQHMSGSQVKVHSHKKHLFLQSSNNMLCLENNNKLNESKKLIRVVFHIHNNDRYKKQKSDQLIMSFPSSQFKQARIRVGDVINKIIFTVASQLCEGDGNQFAENFFSNLLNKQQQHLQQQSKQCFSYQFISSQVQQQTMKSMSSIQSPFPCTSYNQNNCKSTAQSSSSSSSQSSKQTCFYCNPILSQKISSHEDIISEISKRIIITSMSFPNCKSESIISITRQNLNNIIQLQDMQHVSVYLMPLPLCFRDYTLALSCRDQFTPPSFTFTQQYDEKDCAQFVLENDVEYDIDADMNQQFYEALPTYHRSCSSQSFADEEVIIDPFRRSDVLDQQQQQNNHQTSTRSSSKQDKNYNNSHLSISVNNNQTRFIVNEEDFSQGNARPNSTDVSQIFSNYESLSVHDQEHQEILQDINFNPINNQRSTQEQKQQLCEFECILQKKVKLNQNPILKKPQTKFDTNFKQNENNNFHSTNEQNKYTPSFQQHSCLNVPPLINNSLSDISYENFIQQIIINQQGQNNKINQLNEQFEQEFNYQEIVQKQKSFNKEKDIQYKKDKPFQNLDDKLNRKSKDKRIFSKFNFNLNQAFNDIPDFLGSDSELMKTMLQKIEISSSTNQTQQLNLNQQAPLAIIEQKNIQVEEAQSPLQTTNTIKQSSQIIKELKDQLKTQIFLEPPQPKNDIKDKYINRLQKTKNQKKQESQKRINEGNIDLIMKLDQELTNKQKLRQNESQSTSPNFEDQSTHHTCSLGILNNTPQKLSPFITRQIKIQRVLRFLDDSLLSQSENLQNNIKKNREELEQLCIIIFTLSKSTKFSRKPFKKILNETTKQMNNRYFLTKDDVKKYLFDLQNIFPNWINIEETKFGQIFEINQQFQYKQVSNFFRKL